ncbi:MAG: translocation/assembly module TamB domain-containing protein [Terriglobia bacterium]
MMKLNARISWPVRIVAALFVLLLVSYLAVVTLLSTAWSHRLMAKYVATRIEQVTGAKVEIAWLDVHPAVFRMILHGLVLHGTESPGQKPLLTAETVDVTLNPVLLLTRRLYIGNLDVTGLTIHLDTAWDGSTNLPGPTLAANLQGSNLLSDLLNLRVRNFSLSRSTLYWNNQRVPLDLAAKDLALLLRFGRAHAYAGSFSSSSLRCRVYGHILPSLTIATRIKLSAHEVDLHDVVWRAGGGKGRGTVTVQLTDPLSVQFALAGGVDLAPFARALDLSSLRRGEARFSAQGTYARGLLYGSGHVAGRNLLAEFGDFKPGAADVSADFRLDPGHLALSRITARILNGEARGKATAELRMTAPRVRFQGAVQGIDLASFIQAIPGGGTALNLLDLDSGLSGDVGFSYNQSPGEFRANFDVKGTPQFARPGVFMPVSGAASGSVKIGKEFEFQIASALVNTPHSSLKAQGLLANMASNLQFQYQTTDFEESRKFVQYLEEPKTPVPLVLESRAYFSGTVHGSVMRPEIHGEIKCGPFKYAGYPWNGFSGDVILSPALAQVANGRLLAGKSPFALDVRTTLTDWQVTPASQIEATAQAYQSPLEGIRDALGLSYPVSGLMDGGVRFKGTPANLEGGGKIEIRQAEVAGEPIDLILAQGVIANSVLDLTKIEVDKGEGKLAGLGRVDLIHQTFSGELRGENFQLAGFRSLALPARGKDGQKAIRGLEGTTGIHLQGSGSFENPHVEAEVDIPDFRLGEVNAGRFELTFGLKGRSAQLSANLAGPQGSAGLTASARAEGDWPVQFSGKLEEFRLGTGIDWVENRGSQGQLSASGTFEGHGFLRRPSTLVMEAKIQDVKARVGGLTWTNRQPVHLTYADRKLTADSFQLSGPSTDIRLGGSLRLTHPVELDFQAMGHSEAALFSVFDPSLQAVGTFDAQLSVRGTLDNPALSGTIDVKNLGFGYTNFPFQVAGLNGKIELRGNHANIVQLGSHSGQSSIQLRGFVAFGAHSRYDFTADLGRARLGFPTDFTSLLSGNLELSGTESGGQLSGNLSVTQMFARSGFNLLSWLGRVGSPAPPAPRVSNPLASRIRMNIALSTSPDVSLESHDLSFIAVIDANLQGTVADPVVLGTVHLRSGDALIRGNRYKISRGDITMTSPVRTQPVLDLEATTRLAHYDVTLDVTGPLDRAKIAYRSDPPLPTEDILSLLALGYAPQLQQLSAGGAQPTAAIGASALLSQALSSQFSGRVQRLLGVSRIRIDPNLIGPTTAGGARVTIEEQVRPDVTLTYATNTGAAQQRDIRLEWDLSDRISLIGEQDINGVYGVELRFRHRFK